MTNLKLILTVLIFFLSFSNKIQAQDFCTLELNYRDKNRLIPPESTRYRLYRANSITYNEEGDDMDLGIDDFSNDIDEEDELFESKYGKAFTKFIDNKVINNKYADMPSKLNQKQKF